MLLKSRLVSWSVVAQFSITWQWRTWTELCTISTPMSVWEENFGRKTEGKGVQISLTVWFIVKSCLWNCLLCQCATAPPLFTSRHCNHRPKGNQKMNLRTTVVSLLVFGTALKRVDMQSLAIRVRREPTVWIRMRYWTMIADRDHSQASHWKTISTSRVDLDVHHLDKHTDPWDSVWKTHSCRC